MDEWWKLVGATVLGAIASAIYTSLHKHFFDIKRVTEEECKARCGLYRQETEHRTDGIENEISAIKNLLILIAIELKIPAEKMQVLVK